jgi:hypothetical protein
VTRCATVFNCAAVYFGCAEHPAISVRATNARVMLRIVTA